MRIDLPHTACYVPARPAFWVGLGIVWLLIWMPAAGLPGAAYGTSAFPSTALTADEFWQRVEDTLAWLDTNPAPETWAHQADQWATVQEVRLPDGSAMPVDTHEIVKLLETEPHNPARLRGYLTTLLQAREGWPQTGDGSRQMADLERILARPEFQGAADNPLVRFYQRVLKFLSDLLQKLFPDSVEATLPLPREMVIIFSILLLGGILAFVFRDIWGNILHEAELADENLAEGGILTASQATRRAHQLSSTGDYRQAVRYLYLSALLLLDERGLLRYNHTLTNREYLRQVSAKPHLADSLRPVVDTFDRVWYGFQSIDEASYNRYAEQVDALEESKE